MADEPRCYHYVKRVLVAMTAEHANELLDAGWELLKIAEKSSISLDEEASRFQETEPVFLLGWKGVSQQEAADKSITAPSDDVTPILNGLTWKPTSSNPHKWFIPTEGVPEPVKAFFKKRSENERKLTLADGSAIYYTQHDSLLKYTRGGKQK
ncbi:MAG: hypothetical protein JRN62_09890 [Nitrososphaerota archaeon]|nr:hypothetical protein [Nitrososphaerota archaeon]